MKGKYKLIAQNRRFKYYVSDGGMLARESKNKFMVLGYIDDNMNLYKRLCENI